MQQQLHEEREAAHSELAPLGPDVAQLTQEQLLLRMQKAEALLGGFLDIPACHRTVCVRGL